MTFALPSRRKKGTGSESSRCLSPFSSGRPAETIFRGTQATRPNEPTAAPIVRDQTNCHDVRVTLAHENGKAGGDQPSGWQQVPKEPETATRPLAPRERMAEGQARGRLTKGTRHRDSTPRPPGEGGRRPGEGPSDQRNPRPPLVPRQRMAEGQARGRLTKGTRHRDSTPRPPGEGGRRPGEGPPDQRNPRHLVPPRPPLVPPGRGWPKGQARGRPRPKEPDTATRPLAPRERVAVGRVRGRLTKGTQDHPSPPGRGWPKARRGAA